MKSFCLSILNGCIFNFISTGVAEIIHPLIKRGCPSTCSIYKKEQTTRDTKKASEICIHYTASLKKQEDLLGFAHDLNLINEVTVE